MSALEGASTDTPADIPKQRTAEIGRDERI
jgi:hypothetical protein